MTEVDSSHLDGVRCVAFHPIESMVITGSEDRTLKLWNLEKSAHPEKVKEILI